MLAALVLAFGLAMDATAVAAARGMLRRPGEAAALPLLFGVFQAGMAALGWALGAWGGKYVAAFDHWIAFGLLLLIGGKMILEAVRGKEDEADVRPAGAKLWILLALATSIDAAAAGLTLPLLPVASWIALALIGVVTWVCSMLGYVVGSKIGGSKLEVAGGLILIGLAVKILVEHLS